MRKTTALRAALTGDNRYYRTLTRPASSGVGRTRLYAASISAQVERDRAVWFKAFVESFERDAAAWFKSFAENFERDRLARETVTLMGSGRAEALPAPPARCVVLVVSAVERSEHDLAGFELFV